MRYRKKSVFLHFVLIVSLILSAEAAGVHAMAGVDKDGVKTSVSEAYAASVDRKVSTGNLYN